MSSDGNASLPVFDDNGQLVGLEVGKVGSLFDAFKALVLKHNVSLENAISVVSSTPAKRLKLHRKGKIDVGCDADIVLCDRETLDIVHVIAKGRQLVQHGRALVKGTFE